MNPTKINVKKKNKKVNPDELSDLLKEAMKNPGVEEFMTIYENWLELDKKLQALQRSISPKKKITSSTTTDIRRG